MTTKTRDEIIEKHRHDAFDYSEKCDCGNEIEYLTQTDNDPEYYTTVFIKCDKCKKYIWLEIPVG